MSFDRGKKRERSAARAYLPCGLLLGILLPSCHGVAGDAVLSTYQVPTSADATQRLASKKAIDRNEGIRLHATPGEYEPVSFAISAAGQDISGLTIAATDLSSETGTIDKSNVDIRIAKAWYQAVGAGSSHGRIGLTHSQKSAKQLVTELLVKDDVLIRVDHANGKNLARISTNGKITYVDITDTTFRKERHITPSIEQFNLRDAKTLQPFSLGAGAEKQIWVTVFVPPETPPGLYRGKIRLTARNPATEAGIPLQVTVLPFVLEPTNMMHGIYYRSRLSDTGTLSSEAKNSTQMAAELRNIRNHGITHITQYLGGPRDKEMLEAAHRHGFDTLMAVDFQLDKHVQNNASQKYITRVSQIKSLARDAGMTDDVYIYGIDEAKGQQIRQQHQFWRYIKNIVGAKIFTSGYTGSIADSSGLVDVLIHAFKPQENERAAAHRQGTRILSYANPQSGPEDFGRFRTNYGALLWAYGYDGSMIYAYQDAFGFIYNDFDNEQYRDHCLTYPTANGVIDTLSWEGYREGIDDLRYIRTLETYIARTAQDFSKSAARAAATAYLINLRKRLTLHGREKTTGNLNIDMDQTRLDIISFIEQLAGQAANPPRPPSSFNISERAGVITTGGPAHE